jgi:hypothetical protein
MITDNAAESANQAGKRSGLVADLAMNMHPLVTMTTVRE